MRIAIWTLCGFMAFFRLSPRLLNAQTLVINEFLAANDSVIFDSDGRASDWIELYNFGADSVSLFGLSLTDNAAAPGKWLFPEKILAPQSYFLIWASGKDKSTPQWHCNFKLNAGGEFIGLYRSDGTAIDSLTFSDQSTDVAFGRLPDGSGNWQFLPTPTPGTANLPGGTVANYKIKFSHPSNIYAQGFPLEMRTIPAGGAIHFTTDGAAPNHLSRVYDSPVDLNYISIIRAQVFSGTTPRSELETRTYIIHDEPQLPVISLVTDPQNLWNPNTGIYENWDKQGDNWERPAFIRLIENGESRFSAPVGIRIHGNSSRSIEKKNFRLYFRSEYGEADLDYKLFPQKEISAFKRLILYAPSGDQATGASNWNMLHDVLVHALYHQMGGLVSGWKPVALYLNSDYWGIYWLRERVDKYYAESYLGFTDIDLLRTSRRWQPDVRVGDNIFWKETFSFFKNNSLANNANFQLVSEKYLDIENFTDYQIVNIFSGNWDWPDNNLDFVHDRLGTDGRWRYLMWDTAAAWRWPYDHLTLEWAVRDSVRTDIKYNDKDDVIWTTLFLRRLLQNNEYKNYFINRFADLLNTTFQAGAVRALKDSLADWIRLEIPRESDKWNGGGIGAWKNNQTVMNSFISHRPGIQRDHLRKVFGLSHSIKITLEPGNGQGHLILNSLTLQDLPWSGTYFAGVPVRLQAVAAPGYVFTGWTDSAQPADSILHLDKTAAFSIGANFARLRQESIVTNVQIDSIGADAALVRWQTAEPGWGQVDFAPDSSLQFHRISAAAMQKQHQVWLQNLLPRTRYFLRIAAWDSVATDTSYSEIFSFTTKNPVEVGEDNSAKLPQEFTVSQNFPNPFNLATRVHILLPAKGVLRARIFDIAGHRVFQFPQRQMYPGETELSWNGRGSNGQVCSSGVYILHLGFTEKNRSATIRTVRLLLLK